jgi:hypothetical protein
MYLSSYNKVKNYFKKIRTGRICRYSYILKQYLRDIVTEIKKPENMKKELPKLVTTLQSRKHVVM